jgi:hypothetical protein
MQVTKPHDAASYLYSVSVAYFVCPAWRLSGCLEIFEAVPVLLLLVASWLPVRACQQSRSVRECDGCHS